MELFFVGERKGRFYYDQNLSKNFCRWDHALRRHDHDGVCISHIEKSLSERGNNVFSVGQFSVRSRIAGRRRSCYSLCIPEQGRLFRRIPHGQDAGEGEF